MKNLYPPKALRKSWLASWRILYYLAFLNLALF